MAPINDPDGAKESGKKSKGKVKERRCQQQRSPSRQMPAPFALSTAAAAFFTGKSPKGKIVPPKTSKRTFSPPPPPLGRMAKTLEGQGI